MTIFDPALVNAADFWLNMASQSKTDATIRLALLFIPFVLLIELPYYLLMLLALFRHFFYTRVWLRNVRPYKPNVSCIVTTYSEEKDVQRTIKSLAYQEYSGKIEILIIVDGATINTATLEAALALKHTVNKLPMRVLRVIPKWQRGGRVSSLNTGLALARHPMVMALDGDCSFDCDMVEKAMNPFADPNVVAGAGTLRVRNGKLNLITRFQALEYMLSIHSAKSGLGEMGTINNISGAFGVFRTEFLRQIGGWDTGSAEDSNMTLRIKQYFVRHPKLRIAFLSDAIGHTDAPDTWMGFFRQRLRWDGDLYYIFVRRHWKSLTPRIIGWRNFLMAIWGEIFLQLVMPIVILIYTIWTLFFGRPGVVLTVMVIVYVFYLLLISLLFLVYLIIVSERPRQDAALVAVLPLYPLFRFAARLWSALALLSEMVLKSHLDSAMAPWWVLRKSKP